MKKELTYSKAYEQLEDLVNQLEDSKIPLEQLSAKVKQANELILLCEKKLRSIETEIEKDGSPHDIARL